LYQLEFESEIKINYHSTTPVIHKYDKQLFLDTSNLEIDKEELKKIKVWSPSMINMYLDCPYKFFLSMMMKNEKDEYNLGLLVHKTLQTIYRRGTFVTEEFLQSVDVEKVVDEIFSGHEIKSGEQIIDKDIVVLMVQKVLSFDRSYVPFEIFEVEYRAQELSLVVDGAIFKINGIIDRIDKKEKNFRIIDYKTGLTKNKVKDIEELFDGGKNNRPKAVLQILLYSLMLGQTYENFFITPRIYDLRSNLDDTYIYVGKNKIISIDNFLKQDIIYNLENFIRNFTNTTSIVVRYSSPCMACKFRNFCLRIF
jgi:CRISPR/Cas system-associated exonuclease Cas4 (RecB family)